MQQFLTNASYSGGDLLDQLCYADSSAIQTKYFHNYSQEPKGHLKQAIKTSITIISIIITHHFNRMTYRLTLWCPMVLERSWQKLTAWSYLKVAPMFTEMSRLMTKPTKWLCAHWTLRPAWASAQSVWVFAVRMKKAWVLSYPLSAQRKLCSDWADAHADMSSLVAESFCWFCHVAAQITLISTKTSF